VKRFVAVTDLEYFCNKSWTASFNFNTKSWVSFHTYLPNFYIGENNFFYSGLNESCDISAVAVTEIPSPTTTTTTTVIYYCNLSGTAEVTGYPCALGGTAVNLCILEGTAVNVGCVGIEVECNGISLTLFGTCEGTFFAPLYVTLLPITVGTQLYNDQCLTTEFTFGDPPGTYYTSINGNPYTIDPSGVILSIESCTPTTTTTTSTSTSTTTTTTTAAPQCNLAGTAAATS
jgi:hypothetical protein